MDDNKNTKLDEGFEEVPLDARTSEGASLDTGFEPSKELSDNDKDAVNQYLKTPMSKTQSAGLGLANGFTYGMAPRIGALTGMGLEAPGQIQKGIQDSINGPQIETSLADSKAAAQNAPKGLEQLYNEYLKYNNSLHQQAKKDNPISYGASELGGALLSPLNKIGEVGSITKETPLLAKMGYGTVGGARIGGAMGLANSSDLMDAGQDLDKIGQGMKYGAIAGAVTPPVIAGGKKLAKGAATIGRAVFGPVGKNFGLGVDAALDNAPNLATEQGQQTAMNARGEAVKDFNDHLMTLLKSNAVTKRQMIEQAVDNGQLADPSQLDGIFQKYVQANPKLNTPQAQSELEQLKEIFQTAKEGPLKTETTRFYPNGTKPSATPVKANPDIPIESDPDSTVPSDVPPQDEASVDSAPLQPSSPEEQIPSEPNDLQLTDKSTPIDASASTPAGFSGYEKVHSTTIDPTADDAEDSVKAFQHKVNEKLAEEQALGKNTNPSPVEIIKQPIPGSDQVRLVARRPIIEEGADDFKDQAVNLTQQQKQAQQLQNLLDKMNEDKNKQQQQFDMERMKQNQPVDVQQTVRSGGRNLQDPEELYALQQLMQHMSRFREGRGFSTPEITKMAGDASQDLSGLVKSTVGTDAVDQNIHGLNNVFESMGIDTDALQMPGGAGEKARQDASKKLLNVLHPEDLSDKSLMSKDKLDYITQELRKTYPDLADDFEQEMQKQIQTRGLLKEFTKPYEPSGINWLFNAIRKNASKLSYNTGYSVGQEAQKTAKAVEPFVQTVKDAGQIAKNFYQKYTPEALQQAAAKASTSGSQATQQLSQVLSKAATSDDRTRNSIMFLLLQNPGYRQIMTPLFDENHNQESK